MPELEVCLLPLGMALGSGHCQGPAPGPFLSLLRVTPREASVLGLHTLGPPQSLGCAPRAGHGLRASTSSRTMHPWPAACYPQQSPWPISTSAMASCKHDHLPPSLPIPARPPGPTKRGLLRAVWSPLPSPRGLRVVLGSGRIHTHSFNLVTTQSVLAPGLCKLHQGTERGCQVTCR